MPMHETMMKYKTYPQGLIISTCVIRIAQTSLDGCWRPLTIDRMFRQRNGNPDLSPTYGHQCVEIAGIEELESNKNMAGLQDDQKNTDIAKCMILVGSSLCSFGKCSICLLRS